MRLKEIKTASIDSGCGLATFGVDDAQVATFEEDACCLPIERRR
jgi:hypothetical protein